MKLIVSRDKFLPAETGGQLSVDGAFECFTLEPTYREIIGQPVAEWKVAGHTAVPENTYLVTLRYSERFKQVMPHVENIPDFEGTLIHWLNFANQTEGCLGVGQSRPYPGMPGGISASKAAWNVLMMKLQGAVDRGEEITITYQGRPTLVQGATS